MNPHRSYSQRRGQLRNEIEKLTRDLEIEKRVQADDDEKREVMELDYVAERSILEKQLAEANDSLHLTTMTTKMELREKRAKGDPRMTIARLQMKSKTLEEKIGEEKENGIDGKLMVVWMEGRRERRIPKCGECREEYDEKIKVPKVLDCGHSLCLPCCTTLVQDDTLRCSTCGECSQTPNRNIDRLPKNYALLNLIDSLTL